MQRENHEWAKSKIWLFVFLTLQIAICVVGFKAKMPMTVLALVCDATCTISGIIGLIRFYRRKKTEKESKTELNVASEN